MSSSEITQALGSGYGWGYAGENRIDPTALYLTGVCFAGFWGASSPLSGFPHILSKGCVQGSFGSGAGMGTWGTSRPSRSPGRAGVQRCAARLLPIGAGGDAPALPAGAAGRLHREEQARGARVPRQPRHTDLLQVQRGVGQPERPRHQGEPGRGHR